MQRHFMVFGLFLSLASAQTTTTWTELTRENTSACSGTDSAPLPCYQVFQRMTDVASFASDGNGGQYTALTPYFNPAATNISGPPTGNARSLSVRRLLPEAFGNVNIPIFVHYMPWFDEGITDHVPTGYKSYEPTVILEHLSDIGARDFDGVIIDWNGLAKPNQDLAIRGVRDNIPGKKNIREVQLRFALMLDKGMFVGPANCGSVGGRDQVSCVQSKIEQNLVDADDKYFGNANYLTATAPGAPGERPVLFTFVKEDGSLSDGGSQMFTDCSPNSLCDLPRMMLDGSTKCNAPDDCWDKIWKGSLEHFESEKHYRPIMVFRNSGIFPPLSQEPLPTGTYRHYNGIRHIQSEGMYAWVNPSGNSRSTITNVSQAPQAAGFPNLVAFYRESFCTLPGGVNCAAFIEDSRTKATANRVGMRTIGTAYKGFDNYLAPFDQQPTIKPENHRVMDQNCGQTWLDSWKQVMIPSQTIGNQLNIIQVATWNDYDEGTAIEPGIDNCVSLSTAIERDMNGARVNWTLNTGQENTIDHFEVFATSDDYNFLVLNDNVPASSRTYDLTQHTNLGINDWLVYVRAVGQPGLTNKISFGTLWCGNGATIPGELPICRPSRPSRTPHQPPPEQFAFMEQPPVEPLPGTGSVTISGYERSGWQCTEPLGMNNLKLSSTKGEMRPNSPGEDCYWMYDAGAIWITVSGATKTVWYGQGSTAANRAAALAQAINDDANFPVYASYTSGSTSMNITSRQAGGYTCYSMSGDSESSLGFDPPSFAISLSGGTLSGCR